MKRREFLKHAAVTAAAVASASKLKASDRTSSTPIARRTLGKTGEQLSILAFGGIVVMNEETGAASNIVAEAVDRGINYFDVAPSYGNAQERLGPALAPYRENCFLACKTEGRMKDDSRAQTVPLWRRGGAHPIPKLVCPWTQINGPSCYCNLFI